MQSLPTLTKGDFVLSKKTTNTLKKDRLLAALKAGDVMTAPQMMRRFNYSSTGSVGSAISRLRTRQGAKIKIVGTSKDGRAKYAI